MNERPKAQMIVKILEYGNKKQGDKTPEKPMPALSKEELIRAQLREKIRQTKENERKAIAEKSYIQIKLTDLAPFINSLEFAIEILKTAKIQITEESAYRAEINPIFIDEMKRLGIIGNNCGAPVGFIRIEKKHLYSFLKVDQRKADSFSISIDIFIKLGIYTTKNQIEKLPVNVQEELQRKGLIY